MNSLAGASQTDAVLLPHYAGKASAHSADPQEQKPLVGSILIERCSSVPLQAFDASTP